MKTLSHNWIQAVLVTVLISLIPVRQSVAQQASNYPPPPDSVIVSVRDPSEGSPLNAERILDVVRDPRLDLELFRLLGEPLSAEKIFQGTVAQVQQNSANEALALVAKSYVTLRYGAETNTHEIVENLRRDARLAYVNVNTRGSFSVLPSDKYVAYTGSSSTIDFYLNNYYWGYQTWNTNILAAWDRVKGTANIGVIDAGVVTAPISADTVPSSTNYILTHPDLQQVVLNNHSFNFSTNQWQPDGGYTSHGSHVLGLVAANANSSPTPAGTSDPRGGVGVCWYCSASYAVMNYAESEVASSLAWLVQQGVQVINLSGGWDKHLFDEDPSRGPYPGGIPCPGLLFDSYSSPLCLAIGMMEAQDVILVAAAGNADFNKTQFPANHPYAIGVGGIDSLGNRWDDASAPYLWPHDSFDFNNGLADSRCPDHFIYLGLSVAFQECGSNYSDIEEMDFVAPARRVISTVPLSNIGLAPPYDDFYFNDRNFPLDSAGQALADDGYAYATGTSMSSPIVAGIIGLMRSANPIPNRNALYNVLRATASNGGILYNGLNGKAGTAWGVPNSDSAVARMLGKVGGVTVKNRLTPMFVTYNVNSGQRFYTTRPQAILGANSGSYLGAGNAPPGTYWQTQIVPSDFGVGYVGGYDSFPTLTVGDPGPNLDSMRPRTGFWVFTSDVAPKKGWTIKPLYRMSFRENSCMARRHIYPISQTELNTYLSLVICPRNFMSNESRYKYDGIDGYILASCPDGYQCDNFGDPTQPQKLYRIYSTCDNNRSALVLASQLASGNWPAYTGACGVAQPGWTITDIGYAFPNVDSDGDTVPDGMERLYGMNANSVDSDCDGVSDGTEFPVFGVQNVGSDPIDGVCP